MAREFARTLRAASIAAGLFLLLPAAAHAQSSLTGTVKDTSGAVLPGVTVGKGAQVGAGAVVTPGTVVPPGSLVLGIPGKVMRQVDEKGLALIRRTSVNYVRLSRQYLQLRDAAAPDEEAGVGIGARIEQALTNLVWARVDGIESVKCSGNWMWAAKLPGEGARLYDAAVAMYHDQGHIPMKLLDFEHTVNVSLGLPIIRTSVDHGTAFDIAGKNVADPGSMKAAMKLAVAMAAGKRGSRR